MKVQTIIPRQNVALDPIEKVIVLLDTDPRILGNAIEAIGQKFPRANIDILVSSKQILEVSASSSINKLLPFVDEILKGSSLGQEKLREIKGRGYDLAVIPYPDYVGIGYLQRDKLALSIGAKYTMAFNANQRGFLLRPDVWRGLRIRRTVLRLRLIKLINTLLFFLLLPIMLLDVLITRIIHWARRSLISSSHRREIM